MAETGVLAWLSLHLPSIEPEKHIIAQMMTQDDYPPSKAVEELVVRCAEVAASPDGNLRYHAHGTSNTIFMFAIDTKHEEQSKLIDFVMLLRKETVPDPMDGGHLRPFDKEVLWSQVPRLGVILADLQKNYGKRLEYLQLDQKYENCTAFMAQLSELGFTPWKQDVDWNYEVMAKIFDAGHEIVTRAHIRLVCMWLVYAPNRVSEDIRLGGKEAGMWARWEPFLSEYEMEEFLDEDTRQLVATARMSMERAIKT